MDNIGPHPPEPLADNLREVSDGISRLVKEHVELAKIELRTNAKRAAFDIALTGAGAGLLAVGWLLLMFAASYGLATLLGNGLAFLIIGAVHLFAGFGLVGVFGARLMNKDKPQLPQVQEELGRDRQLLHRIVAKRAGGIRRAKRPVPA